MKAEIKAALKKGKLLKQENDEKRAREAEKRATAEELKAAQKHKELVAEAKTIAKRVPEYLTNAVAEGKNSFRLIGYESDFKSRFDELADVLEPELKKLGLKYNRSSNTWCDVNSEYERWSTTYYLEVYVPEVE